MRAGLVGPPWEFGTRDAPRSSAVQGNAVHRSWVAEAIGIIEADFNRSADTHVL